MEGGKKTENVTGMKKNGESKIPKPAKFSSAKETSSKALAEKKTVQSSKTTTKMATGTSSKLKQTKVINPPKNVKRTSVSKISKDVLNHFQDENLKTNDRATESAAGSIKVLGKDTTTKRAALKEKLSEASQKQSGSLSKKPSASDLKPSAAFGGLRFTAKKSSCQKSDMFQKTTKKSKDTQAVNLPEPCTKELKMIDSAKAEKAKASTEIEQSNEGNLEDPSTFTTESSKAASLTVKETTLKNYTAFGGIRFTPKWQSTPLKPDLIDNKQKVSKHNKELCTPDSSAKLPEKIRNSTKSTTKEDVTITLDETVQPPAKEPKSLQPSASITAKEIDDKVFPAFAGIRLVRKRKSTLPKDIFEIVQEDSKLDGQESQLSGTSSGQRKTSCGAAKAKLKTETTLCPVEMLEQTSTQKAGFSGTVSITVKKTSQVAAFGGIHFAPKGESTPARSNLSDGIQKESKTGRLESHPTDSSTKELKTIPASTTAKIKVEIQQSDSEKSEQLTTQKPESSKNDDTSKNVMKCLDKMHSEL